MIDNGDGRFILRKEKIYFFYYDLIFLFYIGFDIAGDEWISAICETLDLFEVAGVIAAKRRFCRSRTDNRGFNLIRNKILKHKIIF